jgi:hypothetical protein
MASPTPDPAPAAPAEADRGGGAISSKRLVSVMSMSLHQSMIISAYGEKRKFLPRDKLEEIVTPQNVRLELEREGLVNEKVDQLVHAVFTAPGRRKLFAILAMIEQTKEIELLVGLELWDKSLPFQLQSTKNDNADQLIPWSPFIMECFESRQWAVLPPVFYFEKGKMGQHYVFQDATILPFCEFSTRSAHTVIQGGFGSVTQVEIHPAHLHFGDNVAHKVSLVRT